jgi:adenylyltransferase/sulfurtransferase
MPRRRGRSLVKLKPDIPAPPLRVTSQEAAAAREDRFHRFKLIGWWDQQKLSRARVLVAGAGALGNEIVKNLALLGIGNIFIADMDRIENSNLSRSVLYRASDNGSFKAVVAAAAAKDLYPEIRAQPFVGNLVHDLGLGVFRWADVVLGGLDNREARLSINRNCWKLNRPWIDGAIEQIEGAARVFIPETHPASKSDDSPCYECTMSETDWKLLRSRRSCNLLSRPEMENGRTPTTPTVSSIIAGVQCQEAVKLLHGMDTIAGGAWVFSGMAADAYLTRFQRNPECYSHDTLDEIICLDAGAESITARALLAQARQTIGPTAQLELAREVLEKLVCPVCRREENMFTSLSSVAAEQAWCPDCKTVRREVVTFYQVRGDEPFLDEPLSRIGVPAFDILIARGNGRSVGFELSADASQVLGCLAPPNEALLESK